MAFVRPPRRAVLTLLATLIAASSILAVMPGAVAEPRPTLRQAQTRVAALNHEAEQLLQWSHVLTNVETNRNPFRYRAYMVLQWSHVLTNVEK